MALDEKEMNHLARLARISISVESLPEITHQLNQFMALVDALQMVDTRDVDPMTQVWGGFQRLREDNVTAHNERDALMAGAPESEDGLYLVPKVVA